MIQCGICGYGIMKRILISAAIVAVFAFTACTNTVVVVTPTPTAPPEPTPTPTLRPEPTLFPLLECSWAERYVEEGKVKGSVGDGEGYPIELFHESSKELDTDTDGDGVVCEVEG